MNLTYIHHPLTLPAQGMFEGESRVNVGDLERQTTALLTQLNHELVHLSLARMLRTIPGLMGILIPSHDYAKLNDITPDVADQKSTSGKATLDQFQKELKALRRQMMFPQRKLILSTMFENMPRLTKRHPFYRRGLGLGKIYVSAQAIDAYLETVLPPETIARERAAALAKRPAASTSARSRRRV